METGTLSNLLSAVSAIAASVAAIAAWRALVASRKSTEGQLIIQLRNEFSSAHILQSFIALREFQENHTSDFSSAFVALKTFDREQYDLLNNARRTVKGYFKKVMLLNEISALETKLVKLFVTKDQCRFIVQVLEPYERAMVASDRNIEFDDSVFQWANKVW